MIRGYTNLPFLIFQHAVRIPIPAQDANDIYFNSFWIRILSVEFSKSQNLYYEHWCDTKHIYDFHCLSSDTPTTLAFIVK